MECICMNEYDLGQFKPMTLPCGHTICQNCSEQVPHSLCPSCRDPFDKSKLKPSYLVLQMLEKDSGKKSLKLCSKHKRELNLYCGTCKIKLCFQCDKEGHDHLDDNSLSHEIDEINYLKDKVKDKWANFYSNNIKLEGEISSMKNCYLELFEEQLNLRHSRILKELEEMKKITLRKFKEEMDSKNFIFQKPNQETLCENVRSLSEFRNSYQDKIKEVDYTEDIEKIIDLDEKLDHNNHLYHNSCKDFPQIFQDELARIEFPRHFLDMSNNPFEPIRKKAENPNEKIYPEISESYHLSHGWWHTQKETFYDLNEMNNENSNLALFTQSKLLINFNPKCKIPSLKVEFLHIDINKNIQVGQKFLSDIADIISSSLKLQTLIIQVSPVHKNKTLFEIFSKQIKSKSLRRVEISIRDNFIDSKLLYNLYHNCLKASNLGELTLDLSQTATDKLEVYVSFVGKICKKFPDLNKLDLGIFGFNPQQITLILNSMMILKKLKFFGIESDIFFNQENIDVVTTILNQNKELKFFKLSLGNFNTNFNNLDFNKMIAAINPSLRGLYLFFQNFNSTNELESQLINNYRSSTTLEYLFLNFSTFNSNIVQIVENLNLKILKNLFIASGNKLNTNDLLSLSSLLKPENQAFIIAKIVPEAHLLSQSLINFHFRALNDDSKPSKFCFSSKIN